MKRYLPLLLLGLLVAGCAQRPIVDMEGVDKRQYRQDLAECKKYTKKVRKGRRVLKSGAAGAALGGAIGAAIGDSDLAERAAGAGAVTGAARGAERAEQKKEQVLHNCLKGRGYKVLG